MENRKSSFMDELEEDFDFDLPKDPDSAGRGFLRKRKSELAEEQLSTVEDESENWNETPTPERRSNQDLKELISKGRGKKTSSCKHDTSPFSSGEQSFNESGNSSINSDTGNSSNNERGDVKREPTLNLYPAGKSPLQRRNPRKSASNQRESQETRNVSFSIDEKTGLSQRFSSYSQNVNLSASSQESNDSNPSEDDWTNNEKIYIDMEEEIPLFSKNNPDKTHITLGCGCQTCLFWNTKDLDKAFEITFRPGIKKDRVRPFPLFKTKDENWLRTMKDYTEKLTICEKKSASAIMAHGPSVPFPHKYVVNFPFIKPVHEALSRLNYKYAKPLQQYAWPTMLRDLSVCLIHIGNTGKTMSYVPCICSMMLANDDRYDDLPDLNGPICIVLCPNSKSVESTRSKFRSIISNTKATKNLNICIAMPPINDHLLNQFRRPCDILICTIKSLIALLLKNKFNLKRLCHLIVEDIDEIYEKSGEDFKNLLRTTQEMLLHRTFSNQVQFVCTSTRWNKDMENMLGTLYATPLICFGNYLEAAIYGRADFQVLDIQPRAAFTVLYETLKEYHKIHKCIVFCDNDDIPKIKGMLDLNGINTLILDNNIVGGEMLDSVSTWIKSPIGNSSVLICTDDSFSSHLSITSATLLMNFSLPENWTTFIRRFVCLIDNYKSPFETTEVSITCKIFTFINESCVAKFPRIVNFFQKINTKLPEKFLSLTKQYLEEEEILKVKNNVKLCDFLKSNGSCSIERCSMRHRLSPKDNDDSLPKTGVIKFKLLNVKNVDKYYGRIYEFIDYDGKTNLFDNQLNSIDEFFENSHCLDFADKVVLNEIYIYQSDFRQFRCKVVRFLTYDSITKQPLKVLAECIDLGTCEELTTDKLYKVPSEIKNVPPTCHQIYLSNIKPLENEEFWSYNSKSVLINALKVMECREDDVFCSANVLLQLNQSFFVEEITFHVYLKNVKETVQKFATKKFLLDYGLVVSYPEHLTKLYDLCELASIKLPEYKSTHELNYKKASNIQAKPQRAYFVDQDYNEVYFCSAINPDRFYVRLKKFDKLLSNLQTTIQNTINEPLYRQLSVDEIEIGKYYLAKDLQDDGYCRVMIVGINEDEADCFFVDFGDYAFIKTNELKYLRDDFISKLPFQVIECCLFGIESTEERWSSEATDVFYNSCFNSDQSFKTWYLKPVNTVVGFHEFEKHSVVLYDSQSKASKMFNLILLDCGFALPIPGEQLHKFKPPEIQSSHDESDESDSEDKDEKRLNLKTQLVKEFKEGNNRQMKLKLANQLLDEFSDEENDEINGLHVVIDDPQKFIKMLSQRQAQEEKKLATAQAKTESTSGFYPIKALPLSETRVPEIVWHQTKNEIKFVIKLCHVKNLDLKLKAGKVVCFDGYQNDVHYSFKLELYAAVEKKFDYSSDGPVIKCTFIKLLEDDWPRLQFSSKVMKNIKYNLEKCDIPDDKRRRTFLDLGVGDKEEEKPLDAILDIESDFEYSDSTDLEISDTEY